jgi:hypothetical protein
MVDSSDVDAFLGFEDAVAELDALLVDFHARRETAEPKQAATDATRALLARLTPKQRARLEPNIELLVEMLLIRASQPGAIPPRAPQFAN